MLALSERSCIGMFCDSVRDIGPSYRLEVPLLNFSVACEPRRRMGQFGIHIRMMPDRNRACERSRPMSKSLESYRRTYTARATLVRSFICVARMNRLSAAAVVRGAHSWRRRRHQRSTYMIFVWLLSPLSPRVRHAKNSERRCNFGAKGR